MKKLTTEEFISKAKKVHSNTYDYSNSIYIKSKEKIIITCPIHGNFRQKPNSHLQGQGCPKCNKPEKLDTTKFIEKANIVHNNYYSYEKANYTIGKDKITITCPKHGDFIQTAEVHLQGSGCMLCRNEAISKRCRKDINDFIKEATSVHNNKYDYSLVEYTTTETKVTIICPKHGKFLQTPHDHLSGHGCRSCGNESKNSGFDGNKQAILYYLYLPEYNLYKIGITNRTIKDRYKTESNTDYIVIRKWEFSKGSIAYYLEQKIKTELSKWLYKGNKIFKYNSNTEIFSVDILDEINIIIEENNDTSN